MQKVAIVTGATSGIGLATANCLQKKGYKVYGIARKSKECGFTCASADVRDYDRIKDIIKGIYEQEGRIDAFVNNAGFGIAGAVEEASAENIQAIIDVNLTAVCVLCSAVLPYMKEGAKIINVSSVGGIIPLPYQAAYSATKAGVEIFSRALANEVKARKIRVCAVLPGDTKTSFTDARISEGENERAKRSVEKMAKDERHGKSPEVAAKVICRMIQKKRPPLRVTVGGLSKAEVFLSRILSTKVINFIVSKIYG